MDFYQGNDSAIGTEKFNPHTNNDNFIANNNYTSQPIFNYTFDSQESLDNLKENGISVAEEITYSSNDNALKIVRKSNINQWDGGTFIYKETLNTSTATPLSIDQGLYRLKARIKTKAGNSTTPSGNFFDLFVKNFNDPDGTASEKSYSGMMDL